MGMGVRTLTPVTSTCPAGAQGNLLRAPRSRRRHRSQRATENTWTPESDVDIHILGRGTRDHFIADLAYMTGT